jgi:pimeloyl-ACP methyl ester carboxylesterase
MFPKSEFHPIIFEEICLREDENSTSNTSKIIEMLEGSDAARDYQGIHLIVLVHGFQGNSFDMRLIKNNISYLYPDTLFLCSAANEDNTELEISGMGQRLAKEVKNYIAEWCSGTMLGRLSFVGHSMGGLIIRAALPYLEDYSAKMHLFMTLSSPHIGYMYNSSKIIDAGMWILKKWKKSISLTQLSMSDAERMEDTYLYKLSQQKGLSWFKNVALVSSYQDQYAPFDSARIQICKKALEDPKAKVYVQMAKNILSKVTAKCIYRIDVNFKLAQKNIDTMIGRAAHIQFLESQVFMRMLVYRYANFFG